MGGHFIFPDTRFKITIQYRPCSFLHSKIVVSYLPLLVADHRCSEEKCHNEAASINIEAASLSGWRLI
jgi:hypothetical protein